MVPGQSTWVPRGPPPLLLQVERTEVLRSCSSPVFSRVLALEYFFEEKQPLQFHVFDAEDGATSPSNDTFLGSTECTLGQVCTPPPPASASEIQINKEHELLSEFMTGEDPHLSHSLQPWARYLTTLNLRFII